MARTRGIGAMAAGALVVAAAGVSAQAGATGPAVTLGLDEALELARINNPAYLAARNDGGPAEWAVRQAYAGFLPTASVGGGVRYEDGGSALFGSFTAADIGFTETPAYYFSSYAASATWTLSPRTWFTVAQERATRRAVRARTGAAGVTLDAAVKRAYVAALRARDQVELTRQQLERAEENLSLAETRAAAGVATPLDAQQARVERGRSQVRVLTARADWRTRQLRLLEQLGVELERELRLTTELAVFEPGWTLESLQALALEGHPVLGALEATVRAQRAAARTEWSSYLPTVSAQAGVSGFTRQVGSDAFLLAQKTEQFRSRQSSCQEWNELNARLADPFPPDDCSGWELTDARTDSLRSAVVAGNRAFPFDFQQQPLTVSLSVSLPVFTGFSRQRRVAGAEAQAEDTELLLRGERLRLRSDVAAAHLQLETAWQAVQIEETNRRLGAEQLEQARERYRVGLDSFVQLTEAETLKSEADQAYLAAVYTFHEALADLEAAVGRPLRPGAR